MAAKKAAKKEAKEKTPKVYIVTMGKNKGREGLLVRSRKDTPEGNVILNLIEGPEVTIPRSFIAPKK